MDGNYNSIIAPASSVRYVEDLENQVNIEVKTKEDFKKTVLDLFKKLKETDSPSRSHLLEKIFIQIKVVRNDVTKLIRVTFKSISLSLLSKSFVKIKGITGTERVTIQPIVSFQLILLSIFSVFFSILLISKFFHITDPY